MGQLIRHDPYTREEVVDLFHRVAAGVDVPAGVTALYFPTFEQSEVARMHAGYLEDHGVRVSSAARWTPAELATCLGRVDPAPGLAARWAAKRVALRALGLGDDPALAVEIVREASGKPQLELAGVPRDAAHALGVDRCRVSLTHLDERALAVVLLESDAAGS